MARTLGRFGHSKRSPGRCLLVDTPFGSLREKPSTGKLAGRLATTSRLMCAEARFDASAHEAEAGRVIGRLFATCAASTSTGQCLADPGSSWSRSTGSRPLRPDHKESFLLASSQ